MTPGDAMAIVRQVARPRTSRRLRERLWYSGLHMLCRIVAVILFHVRCFDRDRLPARGGALVVANHQSLLDPVFVGLACDRRSNFLARKSLFRWAPFRWLIQSLDAIAVDREGPALSGLKQALQRLKRQELLLVFPEGTRSTDGELSRLKPGFCVLARRARVAIVPVAIDGSFEAWPRTRRLPRLAQVAICFGEPIPPERVESCRDDELVLLVETRLGESLARARRHRRRAAGKR